MDDYLDNGLNEVSNDGGYQAFTAVFRDYYPSLCYFAERFVHDTDDAKDIVSDVFTKLLKDQKDFSDDSNVRGFLYTSVRNACLNAIRHKKRQLKRYKDLEYLTPHHEDAFNRELIRIEALNDISKKMETLPVQCRKIIKHRYIDELSVREIAQKLELAEQTVRNQCARAILLLKKIIPPDQFMLACMLAGLSSA